MDLQRDLKNLQRVLQTISEAVAAELET